MQLSVIIVSFNTRTLTLQCIGSVYASAAGVGEVEVIAVDNHSTDGSVAAIRQEFPAVRLIENRENQGYARAVNEGLAVSRGRYLLVLNSDVEIRSETLARLIPFLERHPDAGIVGCRLLNADGSLQPSCESFPTLSTILFESLFLERLFPRSRIFGKQHLGYFDYETTAKVDYVKGALLLLPRRTYQLVGKMDESYDFYAEEMDWCYRTRQAGLEVYFTPEVEVIHYGGQSGDSLSPELFVQLHKARYQFYRKYHGTVASCLARTLLAIGAVMRLFAWSVAALIYTVGHHHNALYARKKVAAFGGAFSWYLGRAREWQTR